MNPTTYDEDDRTLAAAILASYTHYSNANPDKLYKRNPRLNRKTAKSKAKKQTRSQSKKSKRKNR